MPITLRSGTLLATALAVHAMFGAIAAIRSPRMVEDFDRYYEMAREEGRPYVAYQVEYPPATLLLFKALAWTGGRPSFGRGVVAVSLLADAVIIGSLLWGWGRVAAAGFAIAVIPIIGLLFNRIDLWPTAAATVALASWRHDRRALTAIALVIGGALKVWPLLFAAILFVPPAAGNKRWPALVVLALAVGLLAGVTWKVAGLGGGLDVLTFRGAQGWQIESAIGSLIHLAGAAPLRMENGSWRVGTTSGSASIAMFVLAAPVCLWSAWRGARSARLGTGWLAAVSTLLTLSALLSPQFVGWLAPGAAIAWSEGDRRPALVAAVAIVLTLLFWIRYEAVVSGSMPALLAVVARNVALAALAGSAMTTLARASAVEPDLQPDLPLVGVVEESKRR